MTQGVVMQLQTLYDSLLAQRACAARWAITFLLSSESFAALARPPFCPPSLPKATAAGFFLRALAGNGMGFLGSSANGAPIAVSTTRKAFCATSGLLDRLCIQEHDDTRLVPKIGSSFF
jgi:hypothetical protein